MMATLASYITKSLRETVVLMISVFGGNLSFVGELKIGTIGVGGDVQEATKNPINLLQILYIFLDHIRIHFNICATEAHHEFRHILIEKHMQKASYGLCRDNLKSD
jgi:hypothetical protein